MSGSAGTMPRPHRQRDARRLDLLPAPRPTDICALPGERRALYDHFAEYKEGDT